MSFVQSIIGTNYRILRAPADLLNKKVIRRLPDDSLIRLSTDGTLGLLDAIVGRITDDAALRERGGAIAKDISAVLQNRVQGKPFNPASALTPPPSDPGQFEPFGGDKGIDTDPRMAP